ncbi:tRNA (cytidine(34)-2'-O)-methyltransferase [hydrothermal vent metagenome]|uniref:tRNA (Cytidine(34)-2'-O)-methyltransferase n=1 Tax=hydrothermal vent metagenome TaxID=652676 RepID=A0A3B1E5B0_9ZZZZ
MFNLNVVLLEPRMPGNVGTIGRLCFATGTKLHLIKPYGFGEITAKEVKKAGLDYWKDLKISQYNNIEDFYKQNPPSSRHFFATTKTKKYYFDIKFQNNDYLFFGREDAGLPENLLVENKKNCINIPMTNNARSLNIANAVSVVTYDAIRQNINQFL